MRLDRALAHRLPGGLQFAAGALGERLGAETARHLVGGPQLNGRFTASVTNHHPSSSVSAQPCEVLPSSNTTVHRYRPGRSPSPGTHPFTRLVGTGCCWPSAMFGVARLLDAIAYSLRVGDDVHHDVVSGAMEIADHVLTYVLPVVRAERNARP